MAASIYDWSITAGNNATADADINWSEGMFPSVVNDSARQMMGRLAEYVGDNGIRIAAGTANAITLTTNAAITVPPQGMTVAFKALASNTGAVTLGLNGGGGRRLRKIFAGNTDAVDLDAADITAKGVYIAHYDPAANSGAGAWILINPTNSKEIQKVADNYVKKSGGTMTGTLNLSGANLCINNSGNRVLFFQDENLVETGYIASFGSGGIVIRNSSAPTNQSWTFNNDGTLVLPNATPTNNSHAASKGYVDQGVSAATNNANGRVSKSGDAMTGPLTGTSLSMSGDVSGRLQHADQGGYLLIGSFGSSYGSGQARVWWNNNDGVLTVQPPSSGSTPVATVSTGYVTLANTPTSNSHAVRLSDLNNGLSAKFNSPTGSSSQYLRGDGVPAAMNAAAVGLGNVNNTSDANKPISTATKNYVDNQIATCVTNTRMSAESYTGSITPTNTWRAPESAVVTGLQLAGGSTAIGGYYRVLQVYINGAWRNF